MTATISTFRKPPSIKAEVKPKRQSAAAIREERTRKRWAMGVGAVILTTTVLSLTHQADGVEMITNSPVWHCWAMAIALDCGYLIPEAAVLSLSDEKLRKKVEATAWWTRWGLTGASAAMNAIGFGAAAEGWMMVPAIALGVALPFVIQRLTCVAAVLWNGK